MHASSPALPLALALALGLTALSACASVAAPRPGPPARGALTCRPLSGDGQGLRFELNVPAGLPAGATIALYRDGAQELAVAVADLGDLPAQAVIGDAGPAPGTEYRYRCAAFDGDALIGVTPEMVLTTAPPLARPAAPRLTVDGPSVQVSWSGDEPAAMRVYRRDVLGDGPSVPVSPALRTPDWVDTGVLPGGVYAYALQAAVLVDGVPWESDVGPERYVEVAASP